MKSLKITTIVLALAGLALGANAQTNPTSTKATGIRYSVGVDAGLPTGNLSDTYSWNLGGSLQADIPVASQLFVTVNAGYNNFFGKDVTVAGVTASVQNIQLLPVKAGLKFFPVNNFYIQGEAGASFLLNKADVAANNSAVFTYAPQVGYQFALAGSSYLDAGVRFENTSKLNSNLDDYKLHFISLRLAYGF